ncbi:hypothetical protein EQ500_12990 [Lactobacillus sp. XV13L]|nr:hypothetical protein [Lactobacillus sp. XV13L]
MRTTRKTFKDNLSNLLNAAKYKESNGCLEGVNRKIKQIERTAYGYRSFSHLMLDQKYYQTLSTGCLPKRQKSLQS